jgi:predicted extracellular nuclease
MQKFTAALVLASIAGAANAQIRITEWMYQGANGEFIEFTNIGGAPVDMTGWSFDDDSRLPGTQSLSAFGVVLPGESVILTEATAAAFRAAWSLPASVKVIGGLTANLGRNDEINLYDNSNNLIDRLTYGDQNFPGSIRTQNRSGNPINDAALGANNPFDWVLATAGDIYGSYSSSGGDLGNPGFYIPAPGAAALLCSLAAFGLRRRR